MGKYIPSFKNAMLVGKLVRIIIIIFLNGVSSAHQDFIYLIKNTVKYNIMSV